MYVKPRIGLPVSMRNRGIPEVFGVLKTKLLNDHLLWLEDNRPHHRHELHDFTDCPLAAYALTQCSKPWAATTNQLFDRSRGNLRPPPKLRRVA